MTTRVNDPKTSPNLFGDMFAEKGLASADYHARLHHDRGSLNPAELKYLFGIAAPLHAKALRTIGLGWPRIAEEMGTSIPKACKLVFSDEIDSTERSRVCMRCNTRFLSTDRGKRLCCHCNDYARRDASADTFGFCSSRVA